MKLYQRPDREPGGRATNVGKRAGKMTLQQLGYVVEIARTNSMNKAAKNLFISQPALSNAVRELEREIGVAIFERTRKGVSPTAEGAEFLLLAEGVLFQMDRIKRRYSLKDAAPVRFQVSSQHYAFVVDAFVRFLALHESVRYAFHVKETKTLEAIEDVHTRKSDLGVIFMTDTNEKSILRLLAKKRVTFHELARIKPHVFVGKHHPLASRTSVSMDDLVSYPAVIYAQSGGDGPADETVMEEFVVAEAPEKVIYAHDRGTMNNIIVNTLGYNIGTGYLIPKIIPEEITSIPLIGMDDAMRIGWLHSANFEPSKNVFDFVELMEKSLFANFPGGERTRESAPGTEKRA